MEKRNFSRVKAAYPAKIRIADDAGKTIFESSAKLVDIGTKGFGVVTEKKIEPGKNLSIEIDLSPDFPTIISNGKIAWQSMDREASGYKMGIECLAPVKSKCWDTVRTILGKSKQGCFIFELTVFLKDTNAFGNAYFSRYFDWQGMAREAYFATVKSFMEIIQNGTKLITKRACNEYMHETLPFDEIVIVVNNRNIKKCSFDMLFTVINKNTGKILSKGEQTLTFANHQGKLIRIPQGIVDVITQHKAV